jgi:vitamin B12 transporter
MNESQETCSGKTSTILPRGGKEFRMNISACFFTASVLLCPLLVSAQDTASAVPDSGQWFADSTSAGKAAVPSEPGALVAAAGPADTLVPADSGPFNTIVVTAARREQPSEWVSDDHKVIDIDAERERSSKSVYEIIASNIPAYMADNGGGTVKTMSLMGAGSSRTLILVDGKRVGTTDGDFGDLSQANIEKIEVVEGGQSALYGMDAIGGVVNIVTKRGVSEKWRGNFSATAAAYEPGDNRPHLSTQNYQLSLGKKTGAVESFTAADFGLSDGRYEYSASGATFRMRNNDFRNWGLYQKFGYRAKDLMLNASLSFRDRKADNPGALNMPWDAATKKNISFAEFEASWRSNEHMLLKASTAVSLNNIHFQPFSYNPSNHEYLNGDIEIVQEFTFGKQLLTTGLQGMRQSVSSSELGFRVSGQGGAFASAVLSRPFFGINLRAIPAVRFDYSSIFKGSLNGRFGLMATLPQLQAVEPSVFANIGSSYRSPTFIDLYWPYGGGNPDLIKEKGFDVDGGIQISTNSGNIGVCNRAAVFLMRLEDMIVLDDMWKPQNLDKASITGFKFKSQVRYSELYDIVFDFVYNNARNSVTDNVLTYRPRYMATFTNGLSLWRLTAGFALRYSSEQFIDETNTQSLPAVTTADVNLGITLMRAGTGGSRLRLVYDALNITNEDRMAVAGYPLPRREHRLSLKAGF